MSDQFHQHSFKVPKTARFYSTGSITSATKNVWLVLHGYGQLVPFFIRHFKSIASDETVIVAPEGLSRFYLEGTGGRVGATWMTKEDRLDDIDDYEQYLDLVCRELEQLYSISLSDKNLTLLGFSQGGATATRWINHTSVAVDQFVMWCSVFPRDMPEGSLEQIVKKHRCFIAYGNQDPYLTTERKEQLTEFEKKFNGEGDNPEVQVYRFEGGHTIDPETLKVIASEVN